MPVNVLVIEPISNNVSPSSARDEDASAVRPNASFGAVAGQLGPPDRLIFWA
jgi:hypothetical protein